MVSANRLELLQIADAVAREKLIDPGLVIEAMEDSLAKAARSRYGASSTFTSFMFSGSGQSMAVADPLCRGDLPSKNLLAYSDACAAYNELFGRISASKTVPNRLYCPNCMEENAIPTPTATACPTCYHQPAADSAFVTLATRAWREKKALSRRSGLLPCELS